jgi:hypothetical protein
MKYRGDFFQVSSTNDSDEKTRWKGGKLHKLGKVLSMRKDSKKTPSFEKDLVSSSSRNRTHKKDSKKYRKRGKRNTQRGGANNNGKTIYVGIGMEQEENGLNFHLKNILLPRYSDEDNDTHRDFEILYGGREAVVDYEGQIQSFPENMDSLNCQKFYTDLVQKIKKLGAIQIGAPPNHEKTRSKLMNKEDSGNFERFLSQTR